MAALIDTFRQDLRFGVRMVRKNPGFSLAAILTLALGIGGNTAVFTITNALLLRPLPFEDSQKLALISLKHKDTGKEESTTFSLRRYEKIRDGNHSFSGVAAAASDTLNLTGRGEPQQIPIVRVSANCFAVLGVKPQLGRVFGEEEGRPEGKPVVLISDALWHSRFGGDQNIVGQGINLDSTPYTIIGVLPAGVQFPLLGPADVWTPRYFEHTLMPTERLRLAGVGYLTMVARLKHGVSIRSANAETEILDRQYGQENPKFPDVGPNVSTFVGRLQEAMVANLRTELLILSATVGLVLLIACANVASLLLSRALGRRKEIAVRAALGAGRGTVMRQLLTESLLLALMGGALGTTLSWGATKALATWGADNLPQGASIGMDGSVFGFTLLISLLTGIAFGIFPALQLARTNVNETLRDEGRSTSTGHGRAQLKSLLVVGQVALSMLLLIGAGLLVRSFAHLLRVDPGFDPRNVLTMNISLPTVKYAAPQQQIAFFDELLRRVSVLPGVQATAISAAPPLSQVRITPVLAEGQPDLPLGQRPFVVIEAISPTFLQTMHIQTNAGRAFTGADNAQASSVILVNQACARRFWPNENPVGKHIALGRRPPSEVVGVIADAKNNGLALAPDPEIYVPFPQLPWGKMNLFVRTATDPHSMISTVRAQIASIDSDQPVTAVQTVDELMDSSRAQPRFTMLLLGAFSATALILAVVGIYGVLAYSVVQRRQELGIRLALGARKSDILRLVVGQGLTLTGAGIVLGLIAALGLAPTMASLLYKVGSRDLATFFLMPVAFVAITLLASYLPARRAAQVDPIEALRNG